jgi:transposase-like protein
MENKLSTLQEAIIYFSDPVNCRNYVVERRWPDGVTCPTCGSAAVRFSEKHNRWQCGAHHSKRQFTAKTGTIFEESPLGLDKWLCAMWLVVNCKNGISSYEIHRALKVTQKTAWFMAHRIRLALRSGSLEKLGGKGKEVEVDETFIGGAGYNMHVSKKKRINAAMHKRGRGMYGKTVVQGILERNGKVRAKVIGYAIPELMRETVRENIAPETNVFTDAAPAYRHLNREGFNHQFIDHAIAYVNGRVHTNGLENFWSLLKRGIHGTYVNVEPFHLFRYVDEQAFRFNNRLDMNDGDRFDSAVRQITGRRLTWDSLIGRTKEGQSWNN